jgi:hypothetical protein
VHRWRSSARHLWWHLRQYRVRPIKDPDPAAGTLHNARVATHFAAIAAEAHVATWRETPPFSNPFACLPGAMEQLRCRASDGPGLLGQLMPSVAYRYLVGRFVRAAPYVSVIGLMSGRRVELGGPRSRIQENPQALSAAAHAATVRVLDGAALALVMNGE